MSRIELQQAKEHHAISLSKIMQTTFGQTYADYGTDREMNEFVQKAFDTNHVLPLIRDEDKKIFLAYEGETVVGFSILEIDSRCPYLQSSSQVKFSKNYVLSSHQGLGIGNALFKVRLECAQKLNIKYGWLRVSHTNDKAIAYHKKNGFKMIGEKVEDIINFSTRVYKDFDHYMYLVIPPYSKQ